MDRRVRTDNLFDFFHEGVRDAHDATGIEVSQDTTLYLAQLLTERARAGGSIPEDLTLAELHARAAHAAPSEQARTYRELGDRALYALGYFAESVERERRLVGKEYYAEMGAAAYYRVAGVFQRWFADAFGPTFRELSFRFDDCVTLVSTVRERNGDKHGPRWVAVYRKWLETGDEELEAELKTLGILLPGRTGLVH